MWWIESINSINGTYDDEHPYIRCTLEHPISIFKDRTIDVHQYDQDYNSGQLCRIIKAMKKPNVVNMNILCPWNCSSNCINSGYIAFDIMIQRMLSKITLPLYSDAKDYRLVHWSSNQYYLRYNKYSTIMLNNNWTVQPSVILNKNGLQIMTCKYHNKGKDKLTLFTPQSPNKHIFNSTYTDQLAHCIQIPRVTKSVKPMKYCTKFGMVQCHSGYSGTSTMNVTTHSDFSKTSLLLSEHESASIVGRTDIRLLLQQKIKEKNVSVELVESS